MDRLGHQQRSRSIGPNLAPLSDPAVKSPTNIWAPRPPRGSPPVAEVRQLIDMPPEVMDTIASHLHGRDTVAMALSQPRAIGAAINSQIHRARATHEASRASTLIGFLASLATIGGLRLDLQAEPLFQLGLQVRALPHKDRPQATAAFKAAVSALPSTHRTSKLAGLVRVVGYAKTSAAVRAGEDVRVVAQAWGVATIANIDALERTAVYSVACDAVRKGASVRVVAERHGITMPVNIDRLEQAVVSSVAGAAVRDGESVQVVAERYGISSPVRIDQLEQMAVYSVAQAAVRRGESVRVVAERHGITLPMNINRLERVALVSAARDAVRNGESVQVVAERYGITLSVNIEELEQMAI